MIRISLFQSSSFKFNCNSILCWLETDLAFNSWLIVIILALGHLLIPHIGDFLVSQPFSCSWLFPLWVLPLSFPYFMYRPEPQYFPFGAYHFICTYRWFAHRSTFFFILCYFFPRSGAAFYSLWFFGF